MIIGAMTVLNSLTGRLWIAFAGTATIAVSFGVWALLSHPGSLPQARQYLNASACLLTPRTGISQGDAAPVWASMESSSLATHVMVSYLTDTGSADAPVMLNTLIQRQCRVIVTAGADPEAVMKVARANPQQRFVMVSAADVSSGLPNVAAVPVSSASRQIDQAMHAIAATA